MAKKELSKFQQFLVSRKFKTFMGYLYGWGASVVMIGAYFKLTHIPGADFMLALGLGIEALIFFMSAFEPQHVDYSWDNVFVELEEDWDGKTRTCRSAVVLFCVPALILPAVAVMPPPVILKLPFQLLSPPPLIINVL